MIFLCLRCKTAHRDREMYSDDLCYSCHFKKEVNEEVKPAGQILTDAEGSVRSDSDPSKKQMNLFG